MRFHLVTEKASRSGAQLVPPEVCCRANELAVLLNALSAF